MIILSITHPTAPGSHFDWHYFQNQHLPLIGAKLGNYGLVSASVLKGEKAADGSEPPVQATVLLTFGSEDHGKAALYSDEAKDMFSDVANFTSAVPVMQFNTPVR